VINQNALPNGRVDRKVRPMRRVVVFMPGVLRLFFAFRQAAAAAATSH